MQQRARSAIAEPRRQARQVASTGAWDTTACPVFPPLSISSVLGSPRRATLALPTDPVGEVRC